MAKTKSHGGSGKIEVLVLHGGDEPLAKQFVAIFQQLGLTAGRVVDLPSGARAQNSRVRHAIRSARLVCAVATFDSQKSRASQPRANVSDEIARCQERNPRALLVLVEERQGRAVNLGSNIDKTVVTIPFSRQSILDIMPPILLELQSRGLIRAERSPAEDRTTFQALSTCLDQMNDLWINELDEAWNAVYLADPNSERLCNLHHDRFHEILLDVVLAHVRESHTKNELAEICKKSIRDSQEIALECWDVAATGQLSLALSKIADCRNKTRSAEYKQQWDVLNGEHWKMKNAARNDFQKRSAMRHGLVKRIATFVKGVKK